AAWPSCCLTWSPDNGAIPVATGISLSTRTSSRATPAKVASRAPAKPAAKSAGRAGAGAPPARAPGRVRSDASRVAILDATLKLLEGTPLQQISIESIAREAGVGKATIYRWWNSKAAVVIEASLHA